MVENIFNPVDYLKLVVYVVLCKRLQTLSAR